ncbi:MAG: chalcone synthase [Candidatus Hydrogenedentota bacterium]
MQFTILGQGTGLPAHSIEMEEALAYAQRYFCDGEDQRRQLALLYRMAGVKRRHSVVLDGPEGTSDRHSFFPKPNGKATLGPTIDERMRKYAVESLPLALAASRQALEEAAVSPESITHLITVSCSGFAAPGVDIGLMKELGLTQTVQRTHVGFMGCHGALNGLRVGRGFVESDPNAVVLLCAVEICSLHYHYGWNPEQLVANALFADGAAAVVGGAAISGEATGWRIGGTGSCLIPESDDAMTWRIGNNGFEMSLSSRVPALITGHLRAWIVDWLAKHELGLSDIATWAVHPGGPRILSSVAKALDLEKDALSVSMEMLRTHGNMSSPTILFIVKQLREQGAPLPCVALGFGPGLMAEATLFV